MSSSALPTQADIEARVASFWRDEVAPGVQIAHITVREGQTSSLHRHTKTSDTFYVMEGELTVTVHVDVTNKTVHYRTLGARPPGVKTIAPQREVHEIRILPGEVLIVLPGVAHCTTNVGTGTCRFLCIEGIGPYDFVPLAQ